MLLRSQRGSDLSRESQLDRVPLPIVDRQAMALVALALRPGERGGGVEPARKQDDRGFLGGYFFAPGGVSRCFALTAAGLPG